MQIRPVPDFSYQDIRHLGCSRNSPRIPIRPFDCGEYATKCFEFSCCVLRSGCSASIRFDRIRSDGLQQPFVPHRIHGCRIGSGMYDFDSKRGCNRSISANGRVFLSPSGDVGSELLNREKLQSPYSLARGAGHGRLHARGTFRGNRLTGAGRSVRFHNFRKFCRGRVDYRTYGDSFNFVGQQKPQRWLWSLAKPSSFRPTYATLDSAVEHLASDAGLSPREKDVFSLLARGRNRKAIAEALVLSEETVKSHTSSIYRKLLVHSQQELINKVERDVLDNQEE